MSIFKDSKEQQWEVRFTTGLLTRIKNNLSVDLFKAMKSPESLATVLFDDPENFGKTMHALCEKQATERGLTPEQFADMLDGETIERANAAFLEAVADFSPLPKVRATAREAAKKALENLDNAVVAEMKKENSTTS